MAQLKSIIPFSVIPAENLPANLKVSLMLEQARIYYYGCYLMSTGLGHFVENSSLGYQ